MNMFKKLEFVGRGIVTEDKIEGSHYVMVTPVDMLTDVNNPELSSHEVAPTATRKDSYGESISGTASEKAVIKAKWLRIGDVSRLTAPDVVVKEEVFLFRYAGTGNYRWVVSGSNNSLRGKEHIEMLISNNEDRDVVNDLTNSIGLSISTKKKHIDLSTPSNDGELTGYQIKVNMGQSTITIKDDLGNHIGLDSSSGELSLTTTYKVVVNTVEAEVNASSSVAINTPITRISNDLEVGGSTKIGSTLGVGGKTTTGGLSSSGSIDGSGNINAGGTVTGRNGLHN